MPNMTWLKKILGTKKRDVELAVTLWPSFPHFEKFAVHKDIAGIRMNTAMVD